MDNNQVPQQAPVQQPAGKGKAVAALVLGIIACGIAWFGFTSILSLILGLVGLILAIQARNAISVGGDGRGMATAGLVLSIIGIVCGAIGVICWICVAAAAASIVQGAAGTDWEELYDAISSAAVALS